MNLLFLIFWDNYWCHCCGWLKVSFLFGPENGEDQLKSLFLVNIVVGCGLVFQSWYHVGNLLFFLMISKHVIIISLRTCSIERRIPGKRSDQADTESFLLWKTQTTSQRTKNRRKKTGQPETEEPGASYREASQNEQSGYIQSQVTSYCWVSYTDLTKRIFLELLLSKKNIQLFL